MINNRNKIAVFSGTSKVVGHVPKRRHEIWWTAETFRQIDELRDLEALIVAMNGANVMALELGYRANLGKCTATKGNLLLQWPERQKLPQKIVI